MAFRRIYEINTRLWLADLLTAQIMPRLDLDLVPEDCLQQWQRWQIDAVWLMGIWEASPHSTQVARQRADIVLGCQQALDDLQLEDCLSSPYAVRSYTVSDQVGGLDSLQRFRQRLRQAGIGLILDFVPNHTACDHPWVQAHPDYYVQGSVAQVREAPHDFFPVQTMAGLRYMAYGRDPYFAPWQDTAQLNYSNPALHQVMQAELLRLAQWCDGVRCDMAMLCLSDVFGRTWGRLALAPPTQEFWPQAIQAVRTQVADFCFIAEVYWGLESRLQAMGFSLPYDKEFYDALVTQDTGKLRASLQAPPDILAGRLRFLENHDEPRAASRFTAAQQEAAALAILTLPGAVLLHEGQFQGHSTHEPVQLRRRRQEPINQRLQTFYDHLLAVPDVCQGTFYPLQPSPAWGDNATSQAFLAWAWTQGTACWLIVLNYAALQGQCYLNLATLPLAAEALRFTDVLHDITYDRRRTDVQQQGMYFDLPPFGAHLFRIDVNGDT